MACVNLFFTAPVVASVESQANHVSALAAAGSVVDACAKRVQIALAAALPVKVGVAWGGGGS